MFAQQLQQQQQQFLNPQQQQNQLIVPPVQEDFYLLDLVGGASQTCMHPTRPIVAYTSGCMIIVYDMMTDQKINLVHHQHEIFALTFSPPGAGASQSGGDFLISVDYDRNDVNDSSSSSNSTMCLWNWQKGQCLQEVHIPKSQNHNGSYVYQSGQNNSNILPRNIQITFEKVGSIFMVLESGSFSGSGLDSGSGYRATMWNLNRQQRIEMINQLELELQNGCLGLQIMPKQNFSTNAQGSIYSQSQSAPASQYASQQQLTMNQKLKFLTLEKQAIKIWEYQQGHADLVKRIQIKQNMRQCVVADLTGYLLILGDNGKVLIIDQEGEFISTVKKDMSFFTTMSTAHDKLLLGTDRGTICVYHLASLQFINEVPYQLGVIQNFQLNSLAHVDRRLQSQKEDPSVYSLGPPVLQISTTQNMRFLYIKYQDQSFVVLDRTVAQPSQAVLGYQYGHFQKVTGLEWLPSFNSQQKKKSLLLTGDNFYGTTGGTTINPSTNNNSQPQQASFITCAEDMSIFVWRHFGDKWSFSYIDVVKGCFDQSLTYQRKLNEKSTQNLELTSIKIYPKSPMVAVGDNKGIVRVFQVTNEKALFIASHQLQRGIDHNTIVEDPIKEIYITQDELYAIISFKSGLICCYDVRNSYNLIGIIEKDAQRFCYSNQLEVRMKILENEFNSLNLSHLRIQDERPLYTNTLYDNDLLNPINTAFQTSFRILSTTSPNCIQLQQIQIKGHKLTKTPLSQFIIDEGKITGFNIHPSNDYLLVTSSQGRVYLYRIDTGELRGTIKIPLNAKECVVDPSGLYVIIQVPPFNPKHTSNLVANNNNGDDVLQRGSLGQNERDLERTTLLMFEVGTGRACAELKSLFEVSTMSFSPDGRYLSLGSRTGSVCVWAVGEHLIQNIKQVLDAVRMQPDFWVNYPIFLEDYGSYGLAQTIPTQVFTTNDLRQIDRPEDYQPINQIDNIDDRYEMFSDIGMLNSQRQPPQIQSAHKNTQRYNQQTPMPNPQYQLQQPVHQQQQQAFIRPPSNPKYLNPNNIINQQQQQNNRMMDQQIQNSLSTNHSQRGRQQSRDRLHQQQQQQNRLQSPNKNNNNGQKQNNSNTKFYRKTFVEDQQTQVTPHISGYLNNGAIAGNTNNNINQHNQRGVQVQTSQRNLPNIPEYGLQLNQLGVIQNKMSPMKQYNSQSSLISSPNRAELLYRDDIPFTGLNNNNSNNIGNQIPQYQPLQGLITNNNNNFQDRQYPKQLLPQLNNNNNGINQLTNSINGNNNINQVERFRQDFIDRTGNNGNVDQQLGYLNQNSNQKQRNIFQEADEQFNGMSINHNNNNNNNNFMRSIGNNPHGFIPQQNLQQQPMTYEENLDAADLYNPFTLNQDIITQNMNMKQKQTNLYATGQTIPIASIGQSPIKHQTLQQNMNSVQHPHMLATIGSTGINYGGGRIQPNTAGIAVGETNINNMNKRDLIKDPLDIDDDVSDHGPESLENQLKELDGMNKYMHNIRIPTRFANDDFLVVNGRDGEKAYTLGRLRAEEKLISMDPPALDNVLEEDSNNAPSTYDLVEEMYENMNSFDQKLKNMNQNNNNSSYHQNSYIYK